MAHSSLNHNENMPYPVWKSCLTGFRNLSNMWMCTLAKYIQFSHVSNVFKHRDCLSGGFDGPICMSFLLPSPNLLLSSLLLLLLKLM